MEVRYTFRSATVNLEFWVWFSILQATPLKIEIYRRLKIGFWFEPFPKVQEHIQNHFLTFFLSFFICLFIYLLIYLFIYVFLYIYLQSKNSIICPNMPSISTSTMLVCILKTFNKIHKEYWWHHANIYNGSFFCIWTNF